MPDSFVSCKNALNEPNFIDFGDGYAQLNNYPHIYYEYPTYHYIELGHVKCDKHAYKLLMK